MKPSRCCSRPNIHDPLGLRDRAILETLILDRHAASGAGAAEAVGPRLERATVSIRQGKGKKDRIIPLGDRAALWVRKYLEEVAAATGERA